VQAILARLGRSRAPEPPGLVDSPLGQTLEASLSQRPGAPLPHPSARSLVSPPTTTTWMSSRRSIGMSSWGATLSFEAHGSSAKVARG
jgi:hypothetical protein